MRRVSASLMVASLWVLSAVPAIADTEVSDVGVIRGGGSVSTPAQPGSGNTGGSGGTPATPVGPVGPPVETTQIRTYVLVGDTEYCIRFRTVVVPEGRDAAQVRSTANTSVFLAIDRNPRTETDCPPGEAGEAIPFVTGDDVLLAFQDQIARPTPRIAPGYALAGLRMYLETGRELTHTATLSVPVGATSVPVEVQATGSYEVDWGDGTRTGPYTVPGDPYPDGTVTHVYTHVGRYEVRIIDTWTVRWRIVGDDWRAPVTAQLNAVPLTDFEVRERRAVRTR